MVGLLESLLIGIGIGSICGGCIGICLSIIKYYKDSFIFFNNKFNRLFIIIKDLLELTEL